MEKAANITFFYKLRHFTLFGCFYFACVFSQFRVYVGKTEGREYLLLTFTRYKAIVSKEAVFVHLDPSCLCSASHGDVVLFTPREVMEGIGKLLICYKS